MSELLVYRLRMACRVNHNYPGDCLTCEAANYIDRLETELAHTTLVAFCGNCQPNQNYYCTKHREGTDE